MKKFTHKEDLKQSVKDPDCIPGIYNYCDRWCERCAFTSRCLTFKQSKEKFGDPDTSDINNAAFWEKLSQKEETLSILSFLKRLRDRVEKEFPAARSFVRPGFDDADLV